MKTMFLNLMYKMLRFNNGKLLKHLYSSSANRTNHIYISQKKCKTLNTLDDNNYCGNFNDLKYDILRIYQKLRESMLETGKYNTYTSKILFNDHLTNVKFIQNIKLQNWSLFSSYECLENFRTLSAYAVKNCEDLSNDAYNDIISSLTLKSLRFSDEELLTLLRYLELWPNISEIRKFNVRNLLKEIDNELEKRSKSWPNKKRLLYCDIICKLYNFHSHFVSTSLKKLTSKCSELSPTDIVQIMCFLFIYSLRKDLISNLRPYIENYFNLFEITELKVICLGFFRSEIDITSEILLYKLLKKLINNVNDFSDHDLGAFLKVFRYSFKSKPFFLQLYEQLFENLVPIVPRINDFVLTQISHLVAVTLIYNPILISAIIKRFSERLETLRIKDIERMIFLLTTFNYPPHESVYDLIIKEMRKSRRAVEKRNFPKEYGFALRHLAQVNIYPLDLISYVMGPEHRELAYGRSPLKSGIENLVLDQSLRIEVPYYKGPRLDNSLCEYLSNEYNVEYKYTYGSKAKQQIVQLLNVVFENENAACLYRILPHFIQNDIILCIDHDNNAIPILSTLKGINSIIKWVPIALKGKYYWIVFLFATETLIIRNTNQFSGYLCAKIRHLEKVGYIPIVIPYFEWMDVRNDEEKKKYLKEKILVCKGVGKQKKID